MTITYYSASSTADVPNGLLINYNKIPFPLQYLSLIFAERNAGDVMGIVLDRYAEFTSDEAFIIVAWSGLR